MLPKLYLPHFLWLNGTMLRGLARLCPRSRRTYRLPICYDRGLATVPAVYRRRE